MSWSGCRRSRWSRYQDACFPAAGEASPFRAAATWVSAEDARRDLARGPVGERAGWPAEDRRRVGFASLARWSDAHLDQVEQARHDYDALGRPSSS
ncbi:MAG TPA: hypothetical protein VF933_11600 [Streptosporangiaceae bacterium]